RPTFLFPTLLRPPTPTLFPYTTLFRSRSVQPARRAGNGRTAVTLTADRGADLRPEIFALAKSEGWTLYELHQEAGSLENLFHQRSEEHTSELQSRSDLVCRLLLEKKNK